MRATPGVCSASGRRVMERRGAMPMFVLAQSHRPQPITAPVAALWLPVRVRGWSISPATKAVCLWSIMPAISIPWCWSQCCRPRSALWPSGSWLNSSSHAYCSGSRDRVCRTLRPTARRRRHDRVRQARTSGRSMLFFRRVPSGVRLAAALSHGRLRGGGADRRAPGADGHHRYPLHLARRAVVSTSRHGCGDHRRPIMPQGSDWTAALLYGMRPEPKMLECCHEPDLASEFDAGPSIPFPSGRG